MFTTMSILTIASRTFDSVSTLAQSFRMQYTYVDMLVSLRPLCILLDLLVQITIPIYFLVAINLLYVCCVPAVTLWSVSWS